MSDNNPSERLLQLTGVDLAKGPSITQQVLEEVLGDIKQEDFTRAKEKAREVLGQCVELEKQKRKAVKDFKNAIAKYDKELGKLMSQLERNLGDRTSPQPSEELATDEDQKKE